MQRLRDKRFRQTTFILILSLCILLGIGLAHTGAVIDASWWWGAGLLTLFTLRRKNIVTLLCVVLLGLSVGWWRGEAYMAHQAMFSSYYGQKVTLVGRALNDSTYGARQQLTFDAHDVVVAATGQRLIGKIAVSGMGFPAAYTGDEFRATGKLYPSLGSYQGKMSFAEVEITRHHDSIISDLRRKFAAGMESALPEPLASFGMGLLIGQKANLPDAVYDSLLMVGLVHIIAVSGYNLTIILRASERILKQHSKRLSTALSLGLIGVFLLFAGGSASIVRAAIVSVLAIAAGYYGRRFRPLILILLAAAITGWANPYFVWSDVGWYLSFLAFVGVMIVAPMVLVRLPKRWQTSLVVTVAVESFCAELTTLPYVLHVFGQMSFVALIANVLVAAFVPLAMLLCLFAGLAGMLAPALAGWVALPARLLLTYMLDIAALLSRIPHVFAEHLQFSLLQLLSFYALVAAIVGTMWRKVKSGIITDKELA